MPTIEIILNMAFSAGIVLAIVGICAWGIITDRPFAAFLTKRATVRAQRIPERRVADRRSVSRPVSGYRRPLRRGIDFGA